MENYVLLTGATSGIGLELARICASKQNNLILVARNREKLLATKIELEEAYSVNITVIVADLSEAGAVDRITKELERHQVTVSHLINNAGVGYVDDFLAKDYEEDQRMIQLNLLSLTELTKYIARGMAERGHGYIMNVASTGAYHPGPYTAVYYATKAYVLSFTEALSIEMEPYHVKVSALCPGATRTNFARNAGRQDAKNAMSAEVVANVAYKGMMKGKKTIVPGLQCKLFILIPRWIAKRLIATYQLKYKR
ncbi:MAG TPA: SDR family oxidoreductase [Lachnospiraceae bacterium]|nr:SDR family oxidoreductase [Lachnospiraceae bacterium]